MAFCGTRCHSDTTCANRLETSLAVRSRPLRHKMPFGHDLRPGHNAPAIIDQTERLRGCVRIVRPDSGSRSRKGSCTPPLRKLPARRPAVARTIVSAIPWQVMPARRAGLAIARTALNHNIIMPPRRAGLAHHGLGHERARANRCAGRSARPRRPCAPRPRPKKRGNLRVGPRQPRRHIGPGGWTENNVRNRTVHFWKWTGKSASRSRMAGISFTSTARTNNYPKAGPGVTGLLVSMTRETPRSFPHCAAVKARFVVPMRPLPLRSQSPEPRTAALLRHATSRATAVSLCRSPPSVDFGARFNGWVTTVSQSHRVACGSAGPLRFHTSGQRGKGYGVPQSTKHRGAVMVARISARAQSQRHIAAAAPRWRRGRQVNEFCFPSPAGLRRRRQSRGARPWGG